VKERVEAIMDETHARYTDHEKKVAILEIIKEENTEVASETYDMAHEQATMEERQRIEAAVGKLQDVDNEAKGAELQDKFNCCPADDMGDAYIQALKDVLKAIT